ncbi:hypothetical protein HAX54_017870, partial [Datura stramonium]|nr:hypothetical protein [Datura stramonium]
MERRHSHPSTPISGDFALKPGKNVAAKQLDAKSFVLPSPLSAIRPQPPPPPPRQAVTQLRRALSFDDIGVSDESPGSDDEGKFLDLESELDLSGPEVAGELFSKVLKIATIGVAFQAKVGHVGSVLQKCPGLVKLSLRMKSDVDATMLACIAFSCPNLDSMEILTSDTSVNRITGDELGRFVADKRCLLILRWKAAQILGALLFLQPAFPLFAFQISFVTLRCLKETSLNFSAKRMTTLILLLWWMVLEGAVQDYRIVYVASVRLTHAAVLALTAANLSYSRLELLDLRSSISDSGIGMICNVFPETLSKLLLALCPNITSSGIQFASAQLPNLELMDLWNDRLKKLSLWGCSGLDALYLNCPELNDLNLNSLHEFKSRLLLQCPNLESVHASGCQDTLVETLQNQVFGDFMAEDNHFPCKRLPDGSKRIRVPHLFSPQPFDDAKKRKRRISKKRCAVLQFFLHETMFGLKKVHSACTVKEPTVGMD